MKLSPNDLHWLCQQAIEAAIQAGQIIREYSHKPISVNTKTSGTSLASQVVTEVDLLSQECILKILLPTCKTYDLALLTEETPDDLKRLEKDFFWCIDPMDGTLPFIESTPGYSVSIGLVARDGTSHIGVIYDPVEQTLYYAIKNQGAFRNNDLWHKAPPSPNSALTFITDRSFKQHKSFQAVLKELKKIAKEMGYSDFNTMMHGGAVMNACWVLEHAPAICFKFPKPEEGGGSSWDYAASTCLFIEAGAIVSDIYGKSLTLNRPNSTFMNHNGVLYTTEEKMAEPILKLYKNLIKRTF